MTPFLYIMNEKPQGTALDFLSDDRSEKIYACVSRRQPSLSIVLENVHDPHNVSAVLRSCDAVGVMDVHLVYHSGQSFLALAELFSPNSGKD